MTSNVSKKKKSLELYSVLSRCFIAYFCSQSSAKPADWKYQSALSASWLALDCTVNVNIHIPLLATSPNHDLEKNTKVTDQLYQLCSWSLHYFFCWKLMWEKDLNHVSRGVGLIGGGCLAVIPLLNVVWSYYEAFVVWKMWIAFLLQCLMLAVSFAQTYLAIVTSIPTKISSASPSERLHPIKTGVTGCF